ncbi:MAG TPA: hypothetical protein VFB59_02950 [Candidatus Saccharimonadales bacterium]|nr:hypothetical protein [Candidatus Saccharimonadales bacterium]
MEQRRGNDKEQKSQTHVWSDAELRRMSRVFELLIKIDQRKKKAKQNAAAN